MKNICFLIGNISNAGGTERVCSIIANEFSKQGYNISILSLVEGKEPFFKLQPNVKIYTLYSKKISFKKYFFSVVLKVRQFVKQHRINTLIVVDSISCIFTVPALCGLNVKHICWEHFNFNNNNGTKLRDIGRNWAAKRCDYIVTLTKRDKQIWEQELKNIKANIVPILNPCPYEDTGHMPSIKNKVMLSVGRLDYVKGFDLLIQAWAQVCHQDADWTLHIVGSGKEEAELKRQAKMLGMDDRIIFIPATKNIDTYYKKSSFYCLSSRYEGFGMVILEAQAFGIPVISFDCDAGPSEIINDDIDGWLVPPNNIEKLRDAIIKAISVSDETYSFFSKNSYENSKKFTADRAIVEWNHII